MRNVAILGGLLAVALIGSYVTWTAEPTEEKAAVEQVAVYAADASSLQKIEWHSEKLDVTVEQRSDDAGPYHWITITERNEIQPEEPEAPAEGEDSGDAAVEEPDAEPMIEEITSAFMGNADADKLWTSFAPFYASRKLEASGDIDMGFEEPYGTIQVTRGSGTVDLVLGGETYGGRQRYLQAEGATYLVEKRSFSALEQAKLQLVERDLYPLDSRNEVDEVVVAKGERSRRFIKQNADDAQKTYWAAADKPDAEDAVATTWLTKLFQTGATEYIDESTLTEAPEPQLTFEVKGKGESWKVELLQVPGTSKVYARSSFNRGLVKLNEGRAPDLIADVDNVLKASE